MNFSKLIPWLQLIKTVSLFIALISISNCTNLSNQSFQYTTPHKTHSLTDISHLTNRERADLYQNIIAADLSAANGDYESATSYYLAAARLSNSIELIRLTVDAAENSNDTLAILQAADMWLSIAPTDIEALSLKVSSLLNHQQIETALVFTSQLFEQQPDLSEQYSLLENILISQRPAVSNAYLNQLTARYPRNVSIYTATANFLARMSKHTRNPAITMSQAFSEIDKVFLFKDNFIPAIELKTRLFYQSKQDEKAEAFLREVFANYPKSAEINQLLGQLLYDLHKYKLSTQHYLSWLKNNPKDAKARFYLAASYFAVSEYKKSLQAYQQILGLDYKRQLVYFFCGNSASQIKDYPQAIACYDLVEEGQYLTRSKIELAKIYILTKQIDKALATVTNPIYATDENSQVQLINIEIEILNKYMSNSEARKRLNSALTSYPNNVSLLFKKIKIERLSDKPQQLVALLYRAKQQVKDPQKLQQFNLSVAGLLRNNNHYQQAVDWLSDALINQPNDKDYLYARALYKEPLGLYNEMISDFKRLLNLDPENLNIKNALGYTLIDVNQEIEYASRLIEQAYLAMPNNAAVIDSKGWLAYRQGFHQQAIRYLLTAFKISPSADVATHIGEVYWTSGEKEKALKFWQRAKSLNPKNYLLLTTIKKLNVELK